MREPALSLSQAWPNTPEWFRTFFARKCSGDLTLPAPTKEEGGAIVSADLADQLFVMLSEPNGVTTVQLLLHQLKGRLVALPDAICDTRKEVDAVLEQIRPLVGLKKRNKHSYPSKGNWERFLEFRRGCLEGLTENLAYGRVVQRFDCVRWRKMMKAAGQEGEGLSKKDELWGLQQEISSLTGYKKPGVLQQVENVRNFISDYYPEPYPR